MSTRPATIDDFKPICELLSQLGGYNHTHSFLGNKLQSIIDHPDHHLLVYESNEEIEGLASLFIIPELGINGNTALITYFVVKDSSRSKGIGRELEYQCGIIARNSGCERIQLHCSASRIRAHKFYESVGYKESPKYFSKQIL